MQGRFAFNTAIAAVMELVNEIYRHRERAPASQVRFAIATAGSLIFPFAPHLGSEVYERMTGRRVGRSPGRRRTPPCSRRPRSSSSCSWTASWSTAWWHRQMPLTRSSRRSRADLGLSARLNGREIVKAVVVPGKLVNFVVR